MPDTPRWLDELRSRLERKNVATIAALEDYASVIGDATPALWVEDQGKVVVVYAVTDGWLHVFRGESDQLPAPNIAGERYTSTCDYKAVRITRHATFKLCVKSTAQMGNMPMAGPPAVTDVARKWTFSVGDETLTLTSQTSRTTQDHPDEFARVLASVILDTRDVEAEKSDPGDSHENV
jgi:hypothetical protein